MNKRRSSTEGDAAPTQSMERPWPHGDLLRAKASDNPALKPRLQAYEEFAADAGRLKLTTESAVEQLVALINKYRESSIYVFEDRENAPQENLRSTILEELFLWLFKDVFTVLGEPVPANFAVGRSMASYVSMTFAPRSFLQSFSDPNPHFATKDQDFAIGPVVNIRVEGSDPALAIDRRFLLPTVAIECKTYLAKNHLDMCASTAASLRRAMPYCIYIVVTEFLKMDADVAPEFTEIHEVFVLCKANNSERKPRRLAGLPPHPLCSDLVLDLYRTVIAHLRRVWWSPEDAVERGRIIGRPI